jgi:hypothetical protein
MIVVLYQFTVKSGCQNTFEKNWATVTDAIKRTRGSLGSRLHKTENSVVYIAYAQWPSFEVYDSDNMIESYTPEEETARTLMKECCDKIETLHRMEVFDDRLIV